MFGHRGSTQRTLDKQNHNRQGEASHDASDLRLEFSGLDYVVDIADHPRVHLPWGVVQLVSLLTRLIR